MSAWDYGKWAIPGVNLYYGAKAAKDAASWMTGSGESDDTAKQKAALLASMQASAEGRGPSAADASLKNATQQLAAQQMALATSVPGLSPAQSMRMAQTGAADIGARIASAGAAAKATEQQNAQKLYADMLIAKSGQEQADRARKQKMVMGGIEAGAKALPLLSDERQKKAISGGDPAVSNLLDSLKAYSFEYKEPGAPGAAPGQRTGVMAQDLERSSAGRALVSDTSQGKVIDTNQSIGAIMASLAQLHERLKRQEAQG